MEAPRLEPAGRPLRPGPGAASAAGEADPCESSRSAAEDACALADRMAALALASQERLREARRAYDEHAGRRERAAAASDPRAVRAAKDDAQAAFRRSRLAAADRASIEAAAREWLREIDRVNARTRQARRVVAREDAAEADLAQAVERLGIEADGARIAAESAAEACRNARIALATCEERERTIAPARLERAALEPALVVARATTARPEPEPAAMAAAEDPGGGPTAQPAAAGGEAAAAAGPPGRAADGDGGAAEGLPQAPPPATAPTPATAPPAILALLDGNPDTLRWLATALAEGDGAAEATWLGRLTALVEAVRARAIDGVALSFPNEHPFWGVYTQAQCREVAAALAALGYRFDGRGGFVDGRVPSQRDLSLAIGYAGLDPMRIRIWPTEAEMARLLEDVHVEAGTFVAEAAGELSLGEMVDLLGRRAEDLSSLWNAWGRVRPLLLAPA